MRSKKAGLNIVISIVYQIVSTACALIIPRLILLSFGSTYNGVVQSVTQLMSMISLLTLGVAGATRVSLYKSLAVDDIEATSRIIKANQLYMRKVGVALCIYTILLTVFYPVISHNSLSVWENVLLVLIVSMSSISEYFFGVTYRTLLQADQREYIYSIIMIIARITSAILVYTLIRMSCNVFLVYFLQACLYATVPVALSIYVSKRYTINKKAEKDPNALDQQGAVAFQSIANIIHINTDITLLTLFADAKIISVYSVYNIITGKIRMIMRVFTNGLEAAFGNMWAKGEYENIKRRFRTYEFLMNTFVSVVFACLAVLLVPFIKLYTKGVTDVEYINVTFAVLMIIAEGIYCIREPYVTIVQAAGKYQETKKAAGIEAAINLLVSILLVWKLGLIGVVIGTIAANVFRTIHYIWFTYTKLLDKRYREEIGRLTILAINISSTLFTSFYFGLTDINTWVEWVVNAFIVFGMVSIVSVVTGIIFYRSEMTQSLNVLRKMVRK